MAASMSAAAVSTGQPQATTAEPDTLIASVRTPTTPNRALPIDPVSPFLAPSAEETYGAALEFVRRTGLNKNLSLILLEGLKTDELVTHAIQRDGFDHVQSVVVNAIKAERDRLASEWDAVLAHTYSRFFSAPELASLANYQDASPYFVRLVELQEQISAAIALHGSDLLDEAQRSVKARVAADLGA